MEKYNTELASVKLIMLLTISFFISPVKGENQQSVTSRNIVLFIIDGLAVKAPENFKMPNFKKLASDGSYYKAMHLTLPGHPKKDEKYPWSCSMPNPMLMSGSPFLGLEGIRNSMIQHMFKKEETAFVVNAYSYKDISEGFGIYKSFPHKPDYTVIKETKEVILKNKPRFMRVHLQRSGIEGEKVSKEKYSDRRYYKNIWHSESPYKKACERADKYLGEFVSWLKEKDLWKDTVLMVCGDHGQANEGWHEPYSPESSITPLVIAGAGVPAGRIFDYCEIFDLAPTIAFMAGKKAPPKAIGRVLKEALDVKIEAPAVPKHIASLNQILRKVHSLDNESKSSLKNDGFMTIDDLGLWHTTDAGANFNEFCKRQMKIYQSHIKQKNKE